MNGLPEVELAAWADVLGVGGDDAIFSDDPVRQLLLSSRVEAATKARQELHDDLAARIARNVAAIFGGE